MKKNWKKTVAFVLSLAIVAGPMTADVGVLLGNDNSVYADEAPALNPGASEGPAQDPGTSQDPATPDTSNEKTPTWNETVGGVNYSFYDDGTLYVSGEGVCGGSQFSQKNHSGEIKKIVFDKNAKISSITNLWFGHISSNSQLESIEINSTVPLSIEGEAIVYSQAASVDITINAPSITLKEYHDIAIPVASSGSPYNLTFNTSEPMTIDEYTFFGVKNNGINLTIPENSICNCSERYEFKDAGIQKEYNSLRSVGYGEDIFMRYPDLVEHTDYERVDATTVTLTEENAQELLYGSSNVNSTVTVASTDSAQAINISDPVSGSLRATVNGEAATSAKPGDTVTLTAESNLANITGIYKGEKREKLVPVGDGQGELFSVSSNDMYENYSWCLRYKDTPLTISSKDPAVKIDKVELHAYRTGDKASIDKFTADHGTLSFANNVITVSSVNNNTTEISCPTDANNVGGFFIDWIRVYTNDLPADSDYYIASKNYDTALTQTEDKNVYTFTMPETPVTLSAEIVDNRKDLAAAKVTPDLENKKVSVTVNDGNDGAITVDPSNYTVKYAPVTGGTPETKTFTFNINDDGKTINKDGITCSESFDEDNSMENGGVFKTDSGTFTKIVVNAGHNFTRGSDWVISENATKATWTGNASEVSDLDISGVKSIEFTVERATEETIDTENAVTEFPTKPGNYAVIVAAGEGNEEFKGTITQRFTIDDPRTDVKDAVVTYDKYKDTLEVTLNGETISPDEYTVEYWTVPETGEPVKVDAITSENPGTFKAVIVAKEDSETFRGTASSEPFEIKEVRDLSDAKIKLSKKAIVVSFGDEVVPESEYSLYYVDLVNPNEKLTEFPEHIGKYTAVVTANKDSRFFTGEDAYTFTLEKQQLAYAEVTVSPIDKSVKVVVDGDEISSDEYTVQYAPKGKDVVTPKPVSVTVNYDSFNDLCETNGIDGITSSSHRDSYGNVPAGTFKIADGVFTYIQLNVYDDEGNISDILTDAEGNEMPGWTVNGKTAIWRGEASEVDFGRITVRRPENMIGSNYGWYKLTFNVANVEHGEVDMTQLSDEFPAKAGTYAAIVTANEDSEFFAGVGMGDFVVEKQSLENAEVSVDTEKKEVTLKLDGEVVPSSEYDVQFREELGEGRYNDSYTFPVNAGNYTAMITAKEKSDYFTGGKNEKFVIEQKDITDADVEVLTETKEVVVSLGDTVVPKEDYTVLYAPKPADGEVGLPQAVEEFPTQPGEYTAYVTANSRNFIGSATADFVVEKFDLADATIIPDRENNRVSVKYGDDIVMSNEYDVKIVPKGYVEEEEAEDEAALKDIADKVLLAIDEIAGNVTIGNLTLEPNLQDPNLQEAEDAATPGESAEASEEIEEASEFKSVEFPTKPGEYTIIVTAKETSDTYQGVGKEDFVIEPKNLTNATVTVDTKKKTVTVKIGEEEVPADEYFVTLLDAETKEKLDQFPTAPGEYIASVNAEPDSEYFIGGKNEKFTIAKIDIAKAAVTVDTTKKTVTVKLSKTVIPATDYTLTFTQDGIDGETTEFPTEPGDYHVLVKMNDDCRTYTGTAGKDFTVADPAVDVVEKIQALKEYISDTEEIDGEKLGKDVEEIGKAYEALNEAAKSRVTNYDDFKLETACYAMYLAQANAEALKDAAVEAQKAAEKTAADALAAQKAAEEAQAAAEKAQKTAETKQAAAEKAQKAAEAKQAAAEKAQTAAEAEEVQAQADKAAAEAAQAAAETIAAEANKALEQAKADAATALEAQKAAEKTAADALAAQKTAESKQAAAEKAQKTAESKQAAAEKAQKEAEAAQKAAEEALAEAEDIIAQSDSATKLAEAVKAQKAAEEAQAAAEKAQAEAEAAAAQAEADKAAAEEAQAEAEKTAKQAEADKTAAEKAQAAAEKAQKTAESKQAAAEKAKTAAEEAQKAAEADKATAELAQADAETLAAEAQAAQAEAEEVAEAAQKAQAAAEKALAEAEKAQTAAEAAKSEAEAKQAEAEEAAKTAEAEAEQAIAEKTKAETDLEEAGKTIEDLKKQLEEALEKIKGDTPDTPGTDEVLGDANSDKKLNIMDASFIAKKLSLKQGDELPTVADYNKDGKKNVLDALAIASYLANKKSGGAEKVTTPAETAEQSVVTDTTTTDVVVVTDNDIVAE